MKTYHPIQDADFSLFFKLKGVPHCKIHGAMNKVSKHQDGGGYWRCITTVSNKSDNLCRAGVIEVRSTEPI